MNLHFSAEKMTLSVTTILRWSIVLACIIGLSTQFTTTDYGLTTLSTNGTIVDDDTCGCECHYIVSNPINLTQEQLLREIERIYRDLLLDKDNISATIRKLKSVPDYRPSAQSIGYVGVLVLVSSVGSIVILDASTLFSDIKMAVENLKKLITQNDSSSQMTYHTVDTETGAVSQEQDML